MFLHGSLVTVCYAVYAMTPETAHSGGRVINDWKAIAKAMATVMFVFFLALLLSSAKVIGMGVKSTIESIDQALLGVDIEIKHCALSLCKGYVAISRLKVCQPEFEKRWYRKPDGKMTHDDIYDEVTAE